MRTANGIFLSYVGQNPTISVTEFYVTPFDRFVWNSPEESVISELRPGKTIGFAIRVPDHEPKPDNLKSSHYLWSENCTPVSSGWPPLNVGSSPRCSDGFATGLLVGPGGEIPDDSAVESITWGRIKAQFVE